ncbi:hypothetical protein [Schlesneria paludicola]|uniref:hypothetical protein n=1 Tax=Schlesneria paludicola TaxID=360056 RepID=UPI0012FCDEBF|nr:hypothetical protein [Schlesneria paludicola]
MAHVKLLLQLVVAGSSIILGGTLTVFGQENDPALGRRFLNAIEEKAKELEKATFTFQSNCVTEKAWESISAARESEIKSLRRNKEDFHRIEKVHTSVRGKFTMHKGTKIGKKGRHDIEYIAAQNDSYAFHIGRSRSDAPYVIDYLEPIDAMTEESKKNVQFNAAIARAIPMATWYFLTEPLNELVHRPDFVIHKVFNVDREGTSCVRVEFDCSSGENDPAHKFSDAYMILDPANGWAMTEYEATQVSTNNKHHTTIKIGTIGGVIGLPSSVEHRLIPKNDPTSVLCFKSLIDLSGDEAKEAFYLHHYGLPEPRFTHRVVGVWVWCLMIAGVLIAFAMFLRKRRRGDRTFRPTHNVGHGMTAATR